MTDFTWAYWCVLVAALLPIVCAGIAKWGSFGVSRREGGYDNHDPRQWLAQQTGMRARANAAQANSFEALPFFIGAVVIGHQLNADQALLDFLSLAFVALRLLYIALYVADRPMLRSAVWLLGMATTVAILFAGYR